MTNRTMSLVAVAAVLAPAFSARADARGIVCRDGAQLVGGNYVITPYCQDELLAVVARDHGVRASAERIRNNPNFKRYICRFAGNDIRVYEYCSNDRPGRTGGGAAGGE